jgi:hypothetical protein
MTKKLHDAFIWHFYPSQRDRLARMYASELAAGHTLEFTVPTTWCSAACRTIAGEMSQAIAALGTPNMVQVTLSTLKTYRLEFEGVS